MNNDNEELFWEFIKKSGKECDNINKVRSEYKQIYSNDVIKSIDSIFNKYYSLIWAKLEPILGNIYTEDSNGFRNFVFYILSKGKHKLEFLLNKTYNKIFFKDVSKFSVEYKIEDTLVWMYENETRDFS